LVVVDVLVGGFVVVVVVDIFG